jgi:hypothetical protein
MILEKFDPSSTSNENLLLDHAIWWPKGQKYSRLKPLQETLGVSFQQSQTITRNFTVNIFIILVVCFMSFYFLFTRFI